MFTRQIAPLSFVICSAIVVACSSNANTAGLPMSVTSIERFEHIRPMRKTPPPAGWQFFSPNPFTRRICSSDPCSPTLDPDSNSIVDQMMRGRFSMGIIQVAQPGTPGGHGQSDEDPIYYTKGGDPLYSINCTIKRYTPSCGRMYPDVSIPNGAYASADVDHHASVIVTGANYEYDFWEFNCHAMAAPLIHIEGMCKGTTVPVSGGGVVHVSYGSTCYVNSYAGGGSCQGSAVAAAVPAQPGLLDPRELTDGKIKHVLYVAVGCPNGFHVWPAVRSDGYPTNCHVAGGPAEGRRVWLDLTDKKIDKLNDPKWAKRILHAMHNFGLFVVDTAGDFNHPWNFYALDSATFTYLGKPDPWAKFFNKIGCQAPSNPCKYSKNASHLPIPLKGISKSNIHIVE